MRPNELKYQKDKRGLVGFGDQIKELDTGKEFKNTNSLEIIGNIF